MSLEKLGGGGMSLLAETSAGFEPKRSLNDSAMRHTANPTNRLEDRNWPGSAITKNNCQTF
jgi:hypothetical protein